MDYSVVALICPEGHRGIFLCSGTYLPPTTDARPKQTDRSNSHALSQETELVVVGWGEGKKIKGDQPKKEPVRLRSCAHPALLNANHAFGNPIHLSPPLLPSIRPPAHTAPFLLWNVFSET